MPLSNVDATNTNSLLPEMEISKYFAQKSSAQTMLMLLCLMISILGATILFTASPSLYERCNRLQHPWLQRQVTLDILYKPEYFTTHNHSKIYMDGTYLTAYRYENRLLYFSHQHHATNEKRLPVDSIMTCIGQLDSGIHNYIVLQHDMCNNTTESNKPFILKLPILDGMDPNIRWNQTYEDPRLYYREDQNRLFLTATVFTTQYARIAMIELDLSINRGATMFAFKRGFVLGTDEELGVAESQKSQKNWCLFTDLDGNTCILTHACPQWIVYKIDLGNGALSDKCVLDTSDFFQEEINQELLLRCSSGMLRWGTNTLITALHTRDIDRPDIPPVYRTIFVEFLGRYPYTPTCKSLLKQFLPEHHRVEFCSSICVKDSSEFLYVSLGIDDLFGMTIEYPKRNIFG
jgi:hypothetical protein